MAERDIEQETKAFVESLDGILQESKAHFTSENVPDGVIPQWIASGHSPVLLARQLLASPPIPAPPPAAPLASTVAQAVFSTPAQVVSVCPKCQCQDFEFIPVTSKTGSGAIGIIIALIICFPIGILAAIAASAPKTVNKKRCKKCGWTRDF